MSIMWIFRKSNLNISVYPVTRWYTSAPISPTLVTYKYSSLVIVPIAKVRSVVPYLNRRAIRVKYIIPIMVIPKIFSVHTTPSAYYWV